MIRRRTITSYEWHVATGNETVVLLSCVKSFFRRLELIGGTEQLTTTGKNLFDIKKASDASNYITTETLAKIDITAAIVFDVKKNTNYCLSVSGKTEQPSINFNIANDVQRKSIFNKLKTEETLNSLDSGKIYVGFSGGDTELNVTKLSQEYFDIQLEEASSKTPYEPYTGLKPSPSPEYPQEIKSAGRFDEASGKYLFDVKVTGKNLFDINNYVGSIKKISESEFHTEAKWGTLIGDINLKTGGKYNISYTFEIDSITNSDCGVRIKCTKSDGTVSYIFDLPKMIGYVCNYTKSAIVPVDTVKCEILLYTDVKLKIGGAFKKLMIAEESENVALNIYQPYTEQTLTLTSDRPITKWDKLVEQGGQYGWLYGSDIKTFESDVFKLYADNDRAIQYQVPFEEITNSWDKSVCYCNTFENVIGQTIYTQSGKTDFYMGCVHKSMVFSAKNKQGIFASIETFQEWIRNSGTYVWYKTDNKKFIPLSESEQTQLRNLHSYNGTTNIMVDSGEVSCGINVEYKTKS